jgi:menaquinone-dependent protoporphyrinogen IX oxidase
MEKACHDVCKVDNGRRLYLMGASAAAVAVLLSYAASSAAALFSGELRQLCPFNWTRQVFVNIVITKELCVKLRNGVLIRDNSEK